MPEKIILAFILSVAVFAARCSAAEDPITAGGKNEMSRSSQAPSPQARLVEANVVAVHAYQVLLTRRGAGAVPDCFATDLSDADLEGLVAHQASLLDSDTIEVEAWAAGQESAFDPAKDLEPLLSSGLILSDRLPVNVFTRYLSEQTKADAASLRAVSNLYQVCFEMERDGEMLWELMFFYRAVGLPVSISAFGLPTDDDALLATAEKLAPLSSSQPFGDDAATPFAWRIVGRKIANWGDKYSHARDQYTIAREILAEPDIRVLIRRIRETAPQKIAIIGHSFTMHTHWASPSAFAPIVAAVFDMENRGVLTRQWFKGGCTASQALERYYAAASAWKPDKVLFVVALRTQEDEEALKEMTDGFRTAGAEVYCFDTLRDPSEDARRNTFGEERAREFGLDVIEVGPLLAAAPDKDDFLALDNIHMTEPYHRLMAREWLKFLVGARGASLEK